MGNSAKKCYWCEISVGIFRYGGIGDKYYIVDGEIERVPHFMRKYKSSYIRLCRDCCDDEEIKKQIVKISM